MSQALIFILCIVFYINKTFIRLNKAKILRSASCLLFPVHHSPFASLGYFVVCAEKATRQILPNFSIFIVFFN